MKITKKIIFLLSLLLSFADVLYDDNHDDHNNGDNNDGDVLI